MWTARGEGANHAIKDAVGLSKLLAENKDQPIDILRQKMDELQRSLVSEGNQAIQLARQVMAKARQRERVEKPMVWGHEVKIVDEAVPLPLELK